jgi:phosphate transport system substrate-binding protein
LQEYPRFTIDYDAVGSGDGVKKFLAGEVDFAATDTALADEQTGHLARGIQHIPLAAGTIGLVYNLPEVASLRLSREAYAGIFLGKITRWDDPQIVACNSGVTMPDREIVVVARQSASGTTHLLTAHLSAISDEWKEKFGPSDLVVWPARIVREGSNDQVAKKVLATIGAIGYVDMATAMRAGLLAARLQNRAGNYVSPGSASGTIALQEAQNGDLRISVADPAAHDGYPIVGYTWLLLWDRYENPHTADAIKQLVRWCLLVGQNDCERLGYVPLPQDIVSRSTLALESVKPGAPQTAAASVSQ